MTRKKRPSSSQGRRRLPHQLPYFADRPYVQRLLDLISRWTRRRSHLIKFLLELLPHHPIVQRNRKAKVGSVARDPLRDLKISQNSGMSDRSLNSFMNILTTSSRRSISTGLSLRAGRQRQAHLRPSRLPASTLFNRHLHTLRDSHLLLLCRRDQLKRSAPFHRRYTLPVPRASTIDASLSESSLTTKGGQSSEKAGVSISTGTSMPQSKMRKSWTGGRVRACGVIGSKKSPHPSL